MRGQWLNNRRRLPEIIDSIRRQHSEVREELAALPPPPTDNQVFIVHNLIRDFDTMLSSHLIGGPGHNEFQRELRRTADNFQRNLRSIRPTLKLFETSAEETNVASQLGSPRRIGVGRGNKQGDEWFGDRERDASPSLRKGRNNQQVEVHSLSSDDEPGTQSKKRRGASELVTTPISKKSKRMVGTMIGGGGDGMYSSNIPCFHFALSEFLPNFFPLAHRFNLPQIRHIIDSTATARIPGQVDPTAITNLIKQTIELWNPIVCGFLDSCGQLLNSHVSQCFGQVFKEYTKSPIFQAVFSILNRLTVESFELQKGIIRRLWSLEEDQITTLNEEDYQKCTETHMKILSDRRARNIEDQISRATAAEAAAKPDENSGTPRKRRVHQAVLSAPRENQPDPYKKEVGVLAQVKAYSEVAQKRFVDNVYMSIQGEYVGGFRKTVFDALQSGLGLDGPEGIFLLTLLCS